jgi:hypothetical protein
MREVQVLDHLVIGEGDVSDRVAAGEAILVVRERHRQEQGDGEREVDRVRNRASTQSTSGSTAACTAIRLWWYWVEAGDIAFAMTQERNTQSA